MSIAPPALTATGPDRVPVPTPPAAHAAPATARETAVGVEVDRVVVTAGRTQLLDAVSLEIRPGELFAIAGVSGAGKSTLLESIAGVRPITDGAIRLVGAGARTGRPASVGFVPQDDIIHRDLPLATSLRYAARLRLGGCPTAVEVHDAVTRVLRDLGLETCAAVAVGRLSGGQRKRASIAMELLSDPDVLLLDEPTSGLDPGGATEVLRVLQSLAAAGTTVVLTTHRLDELERADRFAFLDPGGRLAFVGTATEAGASSGGLAELYRPDRTEPIASGDPAAWIGHRVEVPRARRAGDRADGAFAGLRRWWVLTRRNASLLGANRLTLAILFGSPALVVAMMTVLFPAADGRDLASVPPTALQLPFWAAFAAFFFGLTAGLLQIVPEAAIVARERRAGVGATAYVLSKVASLAPALVVVSGGMLVALHAFDRLPAARGWSPVALVVTVLLGATSALALGLLASAAVRDSAQATLALPMLCFPQVLFAGAVVAVAQMAPTGRALSHAMSTRWAFEGIADSLGLRDSTAPFGAWVVLGAVTAGLLAATIGVVRFRR